MIIAINSGNRPRLVELVARQFRFDDGSMLQSSGGRRGVPVLLVGTTRESFGSGSMHSRRRKEEVQA
jgi:hypothetical protein